MMTAPRQPMLRGELRLNESLERYNTWRVGGAAGRCIFPPMPMIWPSFCARCRRTSHCCGWAWAATCLIRDGGFPGTVILLQGA